jgi:predicted nucleic-acid-binding Zn-ribbon protein
MKSDQKACRNCGSTELFSQEVKARGGYGPDLLPVGGFFSPTFHIRVCASCGLVEWFVPAEYLHKVKRRFSPER